MSRTKKISFFLIIITLMCATLIACGGNNINSDDPIIGTWEMTSISVGESEMNAEDYMKSADVSTVPNLVFKADGNVTLETGEKSGSGLWANENNGYTITDNSGDTPIVMTLTVEDNRLSMEQNGYILTYEKK